VHDALETLRGVPLEWRAAARLVGELSATIDAAAATCRSALDELPTLLGFALPDSMDEVGAALRAHAQDRGGAYRAARMREIEGDLSARGLEGMLGALAELPPTVWADAFERLWLSAHLERVRPQLAAFNGRIHDDEIVQFRELEKQLQGISAKRVLRGAAERRVDVARAYPAEEAVVRTQLEKVQPKKSFRDLFSEAPHVLTSLAPCVMASPLSVSQFLPREPIFDVVIFDEASQVTPTSAVTSILRGRRLVVAGDDKQLPPTDFFAKAAADDEDEPVEEEVAIAGVESVLAAVRPFAKPLGLRVHYRSRDERLLAFSNVHLYGGNLVTFAGSGAGGTGVRYELASDQLRESDEESSAAEVRRVVDLILEHADMRPDESLGVIALGIKHAMRIDAALLLARRERPDLDEFFSDSREEPFFVKNLERVQGDERDAIILTIGYGRTKTGKVSHNFGPIGQAGGERRLNVAITRAKSRLTLVSSFEKRDLDPNRLTRDGSKLLGAYLGYCETEGRDLGRDVAHPEIPLNDFELDIKAALERRLGLAIIPQYGVGEFRIDLAVQHPDEPGRFVLAIECDGATYHSTPTARMRDRLRQEILEGLGWRFCRIWSTDWFNDRESEIARVERAYRDALTLADEAPAAQRRSLEPVVFVQSASVQRVGPCPARPPYASINDVSDAVLADLVKWINSDQRPRTDSELFEEMVGHLGFQRRGTRIRERLDAAIRHAVGHGRQ
jgi:very-short-patch-repair endonuclease